LPRYRSVALTQQEVDEALRIAEHVRSVIRAKLGLP
jgi:hypothetical protein